MNTYEIQPIPGPKVPRPRSWYECCEVKLLRLRDGPAEKRWCDDPQRVYEFWRDEITRASWYNPDVEAMVVLLLNTQKRVTGFHLAGLGTLDTVLTHPREVFKTAIVQAAHSIVLAHNHPGGDPSPSEADVRITRDLIRAGQLLRIEVLDHVVVGDTKDGRLRAWASMRESGYFCI